MRPLTDVEPTEDHTRTRSHTHTHVHSNTAHMPAQALTHKRSATNPRQCFAGLLLCVAKGESS